MKKLKQFSGRGSKMNCLLKGGGGDVAHNGKSLISIFQEFSSSIKNTFILAGRLGGGL